MQATSETALTNPVIAYELHGQGNSRVKITFISKEAKEAFYKPIALWKDNDQTAWDLGGSEISLPCKLYNLLQKLDFTNDCLRKGRSMSNPAWQFLFKKQEHAEIHEKKLLSIQMKPLRDELAQSTIGQWLSPTSFIRKSHKEGHDEFIIRITPEQKNALDVLQPCINLLSSGELQHTMAIEKECEFLLLKFKNNFLEFFSKDAKYKTIIDEITTILNDKRSPHNLKILLIDACVHKNFPHNPKISVNASSPDEFMNGYTRIQLSFCRTKAIKEIMARYETEQKLVNTVKELQEANQKIASLEALVERKNHIIMDLNDDMENRACSLSQTEQQVDVLTEENVRLKKALEALTRENFTLKQSLSNVEQVNVSAFGLFGTEVPAGQRKPAPQPSMQHQQSMGFPPSGQ